MSNLSLEIVCTDCNCSTSVTGEFAIDYVKNGFVHLSHKYIKINEGFHCECDEL